MKKKQTRRQFVGTSIKAGAVLPFLGYPILSCKNNTNEQEKKEKSSNKKLNILILGGTSFLGPHQIAYAMGRGHSITTFTRGKTKPGIYKVLFDDVEALIGDRANNLEALRNRKWDAVIDNSGHDIAWTQATAELLKDNVGLYLYTSSTGVYYPYLGGNIGEDTEVLLTEPEGIKDEEMKMEYWYGVMKSNSEIEARKFFGDERTIVVRPTYMVGPADQTDRFIYWPVRLPRGGEIMVPGKKNDPVQFIDVRDVADWMIRLIENQNAGTYNAVGPKSKMDMHSFVKEAHAALNSDASFVNIDDYEFLRKQNVPYIIPWIMPIENNYGSARIKNELAIANDLTFTPLEKTVRDIHSWWYSDAVTEEHRLKFEEKPGSILLREKEIIKAWKEIT